MKLKNMLGIMLLLIALIPSVSAIGEPLLLNGSATSTHSIDWQWTINSTPAYPMYNITVFLDGVNTTLVSSPTSGTQTYTTSNTAWTPGSSHTLSIRSYNSTNTSDWVNATVATETTGFSISNAIGLIGTVGSSFIQALGTIFVNNLGIILTLVAVGIIIFVFSGFGRMIIEFMKSLFGNITENMKKK